MLVTMKTNKTMYKRTYQLNNEIKLTIPHLVKTMDKMIPFT